MAELADKNGEGAEKRRSTRVIHSSPIVVKGTDALGREFRESTKTVIVNCYGCQYQSGHYPAPNSAVMLEVRHANPRRSSRVVPARVIWVQRPRTYRALYHVGIEFEVAGNVWDIALPPEDWFPCPEDEELVVPVAAEENALKAGHFIVAESSLQMTEIPIVLSVRKPVRLHLVGKFNANASSLRRDRHWGTAGFHCDSGGLVRSHSGTGENHRSGSSRRRGCVDAAAYRCATSGSDRSRGKYSDRTDYGVAGLATIGLGEWRAAQKIDRGFRAVVRNWRR